MFDYSKLRGRIIEIFKTQQEFAKQMNCSERTLSNKLNGNIEWKQGEIVKAMELLKLSIKDISVYFFTYKVQKM